MSLDTEKMNDNQKTVLALAIFIMFLVPIAAIAASIGVGFIYGAGYGFALFAALSLLFAVYCYIRAICVGHKAKKEREQQIEFAAKNWTLFKDEEVIDTQEVKDGENQ